MGKIAWFICLLLLGCTRIDPQITDEELVLVDRLQRDPAVQILQFDRRQGGDLYVLTGQGDARIAYLLSRNAGGVLEIRPLEDGEGMFVLPTPADVPANR